MLETVPPTRTKVNCKMWQDTTHPHGGFCRVASTTVSLGVCADCLKHGREGKHLVRPLRGLGDLVAKVTDALGIPKCAPCSARQAKLNAAVPFPVKPPKKAGQLQG